MRSYPLSVTLRLILLDWHNYENRIGPDILAGPNFAPITLPLCTYRPGQMAPRLASVSPSYTRGSFAHSLLSPHVATNRSSGQNWLFHYLSEEVDEKKSHWIAVKKNCILLK